MTSHLRVRILVPAAAAIVAGAVAAPVPARSATGTSAPYAYTAPCPTTPQEVMSSPVADANPVAGQLVPHDDALTIALGIETGGYRLPFSSPAAGALSICWYAAHGSSSPRLTPTLMAAGYQLFAHDDDGAVAIHATGPGKRAIRRVRTLTVTAVGTFVPKGGSTTLTAIRNFRLS